MILFDFDSYRTKIGPVSADGKVTITTNDLYGARRTLVVKKEAADEFNKATAKAQSKIGTAILGVGCSPCFLLSLLAKNPIIKGLGIAAAVVGEALSISSLCSASKDYKANYSVLENSEQECIKKV